MDQPSISRTGLDCMMGYIGKELGYEYDGGVGVVDGMED